MPAPIPSLLHSLRLAPRLGRLVLAWMCLSLGVALASPIVQPQSVELICSGTGMVKLIVQTDDGAQELGDTPMDCPMCQSFAGPPPAESGWRPFSSPLAHALQPVAAAHIAWVAGAPLPSRGPPSAL